jgi:hypothetical protein
LSFTGISLYKLNNSQTVYNQSLTYLYEGQLIKNYERLLAELPTSDIADYLKQNQMLTEEMVEGILNKETLQDENRQLLTILFGRGSKAVPCLIDGVCFLNCNALVSLLQN